jgi:hypothetical protein
MRLTASKLRQDLYRVLDEILEKGIEVEIERRGKILRILPPEPSSKLSRLERRDCLRTDPEDLVHIDWSSEWKQ